MTPEDMHLDPLVQVLADNFQKEFQLEQRNIEILSVLIDILRLAGEEIESPYDVENWLFDNTSHTAMFKTGKFSQ